jgi:hypothetical protein
VRRRALWLLVVAALLAAGLGVWATACSGGSDEETTTTEPSGQASGDIEGLVNKDLKVGKALITVAWLDATFNPVTPGQRMSEATPSAPEGDESFYQAFIKILNRGSMPLRVDPEDFACAVGNTVVGLEPTWSGPMARSLLKNSSIDVLVTFKAKAGYQPVLLYSPSWYDGTIRITNASTVTTTTAKE